MEPEGGYYIHTDQTRTGNLLYQGACWWSATGAIIPDTVIFVFLFIVAVFLLTGFNRPKPLDSSRENIIPYNLDKPDEHYDLPGFLEEVSGVSYMEDGRIACVEDERGIIYIFNPVTREIDFQNSFGKDGDYEDIAVVGTTAYVLRFDGIIFEVQDFATGEGRVEIHKTVLTKKNDTEGLAYDRQTHSLLLACKGSPSLKTGKNYEDLKAVYRFDLQAKELVITPHFLFDLTGKISTGKKDGSGKKKTKDRGIRFHASGISIDPLQDWVYIISTRGKMLIILDREGEVRAMRELNKKVHKQPEGICFSPAGDLYISNEGRGGKGNILKFALKPGS